MASFERRRFQRSIAVGVVLTLFACAADQLGLLSPLDNWCYDVRALECQFFTPRPDDRIVHVDIDDASLKPGAVGSWPWSRATLSRIIDEIDRADPKAIALDMEFSEAKPSSGDTTANTNPAGAGDDAMLADCLAKKTTLLAASFRLLSLETPTRAQAIALDEMDKDPELTPSEFVQRIRLRGVDFQGPYDAQDLYVHALSTAISSRVARELSQTSLSDRELIARVLPHTDPGIRSTAVDLLMQEASAFRERQAFRRFGIDEPKLPLPVVSGRFDWLPLPTLARSAKFCGFVNYDIFPSPTLRSIPLMVESDHQIYPQFGLALGCAVMGVDIRQARIEPDEIVIPKPDGGELHIPTHSYHSKVLDRDFSAVCDIPWFGGRDPFAMYDWPNYRLYRNHLSVNVVWDICKTIDKIRNNNGAIDDNLQIILGSGGNFEVDPDYARKYAASLPAVDDTAAREKAAGFARASLEESPMFQGLLSIPATERTATERTQLEQLQRAKAALNALLESNRQLLAQRDSLRSNLANSLAGKGVLMGWTAEGTFDVVNTSLHARCPGVIIHGVIAEGVISGRWPHPAPLWLGLAFVLLLGFATTVFVAKLSPLPGVAAALLLMGSYLLLNGLFFFDYGTWIVPVAGPVVAISVVWSGCTLQRVIFEGIERNRVATEVAIISREMALAHKVQAALIPKTPPKISGLEADGWTLPADVTGGDCYDLWPLSDGRLAILVADASGHGLAPAMIVSQVRTLLRALSELELHPSDLLRRVNTRLAEDLEPGRFITVFLGFLGAEGLLEYASAGHGPQFWYGNDGQELQQLDSTGAPLGFDTEWLCDDPGAPILITEGGTLAIFSDGIFEAMNPKAQLFGIDRLKEILQKNRGQPGNVIIQQIKAAVLQWQQKPIPGDDQTIVIARRIPAPDAQQP